MKGLSNISKIKVSQQKIEMCDISVEDVHCFYANGVLTHNCSEELRLVANLSKEQTFIQAVKAKEDLHLATSRQVFGVASKEGRKKVKTLNFGILYGMSVPSIAKRLKIPIFEAQKLRARYDQRMSNLSKWIKVQQQRARKNMYVQTFFGRRRPLDTWYNTSDPAKIGFANRSAINTPVQGPVTGDTRILTDKGYYTVNELVKICDESKMTEGIKVWTGRNWAPFTLKYQGVRNCVRVRSPYVDLVCSTEHLLLTEEGWKEAFECDGVTIITSPAREEEFDQKAPCVILSPEEDAWIVGFLLGDGYVTSKQAKFVHNELERDKVWSRISRLSSLYHLVQSKYYKGGNRAVGRGAFQIARRDFVEKLIELGWNVEWNSHSKRIPDWYFKASLEVRKALIRGLHDSDGTKGEYEVGWHLSNKDLCYDIHHLLRTLGVKSGVHQCSDGSWITYVSDRKRLCSILGVEDNKKEQNQSFITKELGYSLGEALKGKLKSSRSRALACKLRKGKNVTINSAESLMAEAGIQMNLLSTERVSVTDAGRHDTWCISMEHPDHSYCANGTISHNCIPANLLFEFNDYCISAYDPTQKYKEHDNPTGGKGVITFRGKSVCNLHYSRGGEFFICDTYHKVLTKDNLLKQACTLDKRTKVQLAPLQKKRHLLQSLFSFNEHPLTEALAFIKKKTKVLKMKHLYKLFAKAYFCHDKVTCSYIDAANLRTIASMHGWNLVIEDFKDDKCVCKLKWTRAKTAKFGAIKPLDTKEVASVSVRYGRPTYYSQGVIHKNTAADLLRMKLCELYDKMQNDTYWKENVIVGWSVYDEIELYVKKDAWRRVFKDFERFMFYQADNWEIPVEVDAGAGASWGQCLDFIMNDDLKITGIKKVEWFEGMDPFKDGEQY